MEYSTHGIGDFRESCLQVRDSKGHTDCKLQYISHEIFKIRSLLSIIHNQFLAKCINKVLGTAGNDKLIRILVLQKMAETEKPDLIIGTSMGGMYIKPGNTSELIAYFAISRYG